jgi:hypothetical protein
LTTIYTKNVGANKKLSSQGIFQSYPGNTIVCHVSDQPKLVEAISWVRQQYISNLPFAHKVVWTPAESFHMTVMELLCHYNRESTHWSSKLALDSPLPKADRFFARQLEQVVFPEKVIMKIDHVDIKSIRLNPCDESVGHSLTAFRNRVAEATGVRFPNHDTYRFHISFGYLYIQLTSEEETQFRSLQQAISEQLAERLPLIHMEKPEYVIFDDMSKFVPFTEEARELLRQGN